MLNINEFEVVVHEKNIFKVLSKFPPFCPLNDQPLDLIISESQFPRGASYQIWLK